MRSSLFTFTAASLSTLASAQDAAKYCDKLDRCFISKTLDNGITYGLAIPQTSETPFDTILQITAPKEIGWAGWSWSNSMLRTPLSLAWANGDKVVVSSRSTTSYALPVAYNGATLNVLDGSYVNDTHWVATIHCVGCSKWEDLNSSDKGLSPGATNKVSYVYSKKPVDTPDNPDSGLNYHDEAVPFDLDFTKAQSPDFKKWVPDSPGPTGTTSTSATPTATGTQTSGPPAPTGSLPVPSSCGDLKARFPLKTADGWSFAKLAGNLKTPRGMAVDNLGNLLVVEMNSGVSIHTFGEDGCIAYSTQLLDKKALTHGITFSVDGKYLLVSSIDTVWRYTYDAETRKLGNEEVVVKDMFRGTHFTRTLVIPPKTPDLLVVSLGSNTNLDQAAFAKETGRAIVKVFDLSKKPEGGYTYNTEGHYLGYGLRNEVALAVDNNNMVWGVENSADDFARIIDGKETDIHNDNPAEELNYLGDPSKSNEKWYGYPTCFTTWGGELFPDGNWTTGQQFIPEPNSTWSDKTCQEKATPPRLSIQAHSAPIDSKFDRKNENLYVTLHGSWNRDTPTGFKVITIPFKGANGTGYEPVADNHSKDGYDDILWDPQEGCDGTKCFRPSGLVWDKDHTRLIVASDNGKEGEIYVLYNKSLNGTMATGKWRRGGSRKISFY